MESESNVPKWFHDYTLEHERYHRELAERIERVETRLVRWILAGFSILGAIMLFGDRLTGG